MNFTVGGGGLVRIYKNINSDWTYVRGGRVLQVYEKKHSMTELKEEGGG